MSGWFESGCHAHPAGGWRARWYRIIFLHDTRSGWWFDVILIVAILLSVGAAVLDSIALVHERHARWLYVAEWAFTIAFTAEYLLRILIVDRPWRYMRSFYGLIDLLAILPTYLSLLFPGTQFLVVIRILRVLRVFRLLKLVQYNREARVLVTALGQSWRKILVFLAFMLGLVTVFGSLMYVVEGPENGFVSIPTSMYWAIVTVSTVGYGDVAPATALGRMIASALILIGYGILAVPTGIYTSALLDSNKRHIDERACQCCGLEGHLDDGRYCRRCGTRLVED